MAVRVEVAAGVAGLLEPGFFVDVIVTVRPEEETIAADWVTETILQDVLVVATEDVQVKQESGRASPRRDILVTLEVDPEEAERLAMASWLGQLHLALRHADDHLLLEHRGPLVTNAMVGLAATSPTSQQHRKRWSAQRQKATPSSTAEVIQGSQVDLQRFDPSGKKVDGSNGARRR